MGQIALNCDLGEAYGVYSLVDETKIIPLIDQANIACGFHGGDPSTIMASLRLCHMHSVSVGAHPSYPDRQGFGRRSMAMHQEELADHLYYQISALVGMAAIQGITVDYVKPHGALYNDMLRDTAIFDTVLQVVSSFSPNLKLMLLATPHYQAFLQEAKLKNVSLLFEAFADRRYQHNGELVPRSSSDAVLNEEEAIIQARRFMQGKSDFPVDSLCVHGDSPAAINMVKHIRAMIHQDD